MINTSHTGPLNSKNAWLQDERFHFSEPIQSFQSSVGFTASCFNEQAVPEGDKEDKQGATLSLAAAKDLSVEAAVEEFCFLVIRTKQENHYRKTSQNNTVLVLLMILLGCSLTAAKL